MPSNVKIKLKKKQYNSSVDDVAGALTFDTVTKEIYLEGDRYGHFTTMDATGTINSSSTDQQFPTARSVYNYVLAGLNDNVNYATAYANSLIEQGVVTPIPTVPSMLYAPEVITNTTDTTCTLNPMKGNAVYIFTQPMAQLNITSFAALNLETTIYFTTHATTDFSYSFPQGAYKANIIKFDKGCHYCVSVKDGVVLCEKIDRFANESSFIFGSEQLLGGVLKSNPTIVDIAGTTPVISSTQPYTIYNFGEIISLTMQQVPSNTLETICYFSAGNTPVNLVLSGTLPLKLSVGSVTSLTNGSFCLVIKDGVIVITEIKEI